MKQKRKQVKMPSSRGCIALGAAGTTLLWLLMVQHMPASVASSSWWVRYPTFPKLECKCDGSLTSYLCPSCYVSCELAPDATDQFLSKSTKASPEKELVGQERAAVLIADALRAADGRKPLTFHFCGENGVGKSQTALLLTQAYFKNKDARTKMGKGTLWISGKKYQLVKTEVDIKQAHDEIHEQIFEHLAKCPQGIVIMDEVEMIRKEIVRALGIFIDDTMMVVSSLKNPHLKVSTQEAVFILISDFGSEEIKTGSESWDQVLEKVAQETKKIIHDNRMVQRIQHVIPFLPVPDLNCSSRIGNVSPPVEELVTFLVRQLRTHPQLLKNRIVVKDIAANVHAISEKLIHLMLANVHDCEKNYRGIHNLFYDKIVGPLLKKLPHPSDIQNREVSMVIRVPFSESEIIYTPSSEDEL